MTRTDLKLLERIFDAEISNRLPAQIRSKHLPRLEKEGYVSRMEIVLGGGLPVTVKGWALTELGRMTYCESCK